MLWPHLCHQNNAPQYYFYSTPVLLPLASLPSSWVYLCSLSPHDTYKHLQFPRQSHALVFGFVCVLFPLRAPNSPFSVEFSCSLSSELRHHYLLKVLQLPLPSDRWTPLPLCFWLRGFLDCNTESLSYSCLLYLSLFLLVFISRSSLSPSPALLPCLAQEPLWRLLWLEWKHRVLSPTRFIYSWLLVLLLHGTHYSVRVFHEGLSLLFAHPFRLSTLHVIGPCKYSAAD